MSDAPGLAVELRGVSVHQGRIAALRGVSLSVAPGEAVALVGPSGAGKTTLLGLLQGVVRPSEGEVLVDGRRWDRLDGVEVRRLRRRIASVPQDLCLVPQLRVVQNVATGRLGRLGLLGSLRALFFPPDDLLVEIHALLDRVGIAERLFDPTARLSGGERQRVAVARALHQEPRLLLADEPVASVDPARARDTVALLVDLCRERSITLLVSLHHVEIARDLFGRLIGLRRGRVLFDAPPSDVPRERFAALFDLAGGDR